MKGKERDHAHVIPSPQLSLSQQSWSQHFIQNIQSINPPRTSQAANYLNSNKNSFLDKSPGGGAFVTTQKSSGGVVQGGSQSHFLKAYSTTVRWYPMMMKEKVKSEASIKTIKELRDSNMRETLKKVQNFQFQEANVKSNQFHLDRIDAEIEKRIQQSLKNTDMAQVRQQEEIQQYLKEYQKTGEKLLSVDNSKEPTPKGGNTPAISARGGAEQSIHIENQNQPQLEQVVKVGTFRTASKLKDLMIPATDIKLKYQKRKEEFQSIREINQKSELAQEILLKDKQHRTSILNINHPNRDVSFMFESLPPPEKNQVTAALTINNQLVVPRQNKTLMNVTPASFYSQNFTLRRIDSKQQVQFVKNQDNLQKLPRNLDSLKELSQKIGHMKDSGLAKNLPVKPLRRVPSDYFIRNVSLEQQHLRSSDSPLQRVQDDHVLAAFEQRSSLKAEQSSKKSGKEQSLAEQYERNKRIEEELLASFHTMKLSSRVDTVALEEWMSKILDLIQQHCTTQHGSGNREKTVVDEKFELTQLVYNLAFVELAKQVGAECYERGILMNQIWQAVLALMAEQLKLINGERNVLERRTILNMEQFHKFYEDQLEGQRESMMRMYKESMNYKRSYERLSKDFESLKVKTQVLGQKLQEVTVLYKQQYTKVDFLQRTINNLQGVIASLQEDDMEEDPNLGNDYFLQQQEKSPQQRNLDEFLVVGQLPLDEQLNHLDLIGKDLQGFLESTEEKRDREQAALQDAEHFTTEMMGEFFEEAGTDMAEFNEFLLETGMSVEVEIQLVKEDLVRFVDKGLLMNEDIMLEDIGFDCRAANEQEHLRRIKELEDLNENYCDEIAKLNLQYDLKDHECNLQKVRIHELEEELSSLTLESNLKQELIDSQANELMDLKEELQRCNLRIQKYKEQVQQLQQENQELNYLIAKQNQMLEKGSLIDGSELSQVGFGRKKKKGYYQQSSDEDDSRFEGEEEKSQFDSRRRKTAARAFQIKARDKTKFQFAEFNLGYRPERKIRQHPSEPLFQKFLKKKSVKNIMPKNQLLRQITQFYNDLGDLLKSNQQIPPLVPYIYDSLMNKYGIKKIGQQKFKQLLGSTYKLSPNSERVAMFGRLMRIVKPAFDNNDIKMYVQVARYLQTLNIGVKIDNQEGDEAHIYPYVRANECVKTHFEGKVPIDEWTEIRKKLDELKRPDPKGINKGGVVEVDPFAELILNQYHRLEVLAAERVYELFLATDFNNNGFISCEEFTVSYRNVVQGNMGKEYAKLLFQDYMEEVVDQDLTLYGISIDSYMLLALEFDILKVRDQNHFLSPLQIERQFSEMMTELILYRPVWEQRLQHINQLNEEWKENLYMFSKDLKEEALSKRVLLLRFKLIEAETKELVLDFYEDKFFDSKLNAFVKLGVDMAYTSDYSAKNEVTMEELWQKKKLAGIKSSFAVAKETIEEEDEGREGKEGEEGDGQKKKKRKKRKQQ